MKRQSKDQGKRRFEKHVKNNLTKKEKKNKTNETLVKRIFAIQ